MLKPLSTDCTFREFRSKRQELTRLALTRPDIAARANLLAQVTEDKWDRNAVKELNKIIYNVKETPKRGIRQHHLDKDTLSMKVFSDSPFANTPELKSQLGYLILLCDESGKCNILHFASYKSKRIVRSVMGGEAYAFANGFDFSFTLRHDLERMIAQNIPLTMYTDSDSLFKVIKKSTTTTERRLMIDIRAAREAYQREEISDIAWIRGDQNPADGLTKKSPCSALNKGFVGIRMFFPKQY